MQEKCEVEGRSILHVLHVIPTEEEINDLSRKEPGEGNGEQRAESGADDEPADDGETTIQRSEPAKQGEGRGAQSRAVSRMPCRAVEDAGPCRGCRAVPVEVAGPCFGALRLCNGGRFGVCKESSCIGVGFAASAATVSRASSWRDVSRASSWRDVYPKCIRFSVFLGTCSKISLSASSSWYNSLGARLFRLFFSCRG